MALLANAAVLDERAGGRTLPAISVPNSVLSAVGSSFASAAGRGEAG